MFRDSLWKKVCFLFLVISFFGCSNKGDGLRRWMEKEDGIRVLSTTAQIGDLVHRIGGTRVNGWVLIEGNLDPHSYELVKGDDEKLSRAQLIFYNGLGLEHGAGLAATLRETNQAVALGERIAQLAPEKILKRGPVVDPHLWMDISLWMKGIDPIVEHLSRIDPEGKAEYEARGEECRQEMEEAHAAVLEILSQIPEEKRYLVTSHDAFQYFARSYLKGSAAPEGLAPDGQLNPTDIKRIIGFLQEHQIEVLFPESNLNQDVIRKIASVGLELHLQVTICEEPLYGDAMGGLSYLEMMKKNAETIARNLR
jgi:manganese/zinc/iron transport system substrate-binding protein